MGEGTICHLHWQKQTQSSNYTQHRYNLWFWDSSLFGQLPVSNSPLPNPLPQGEREQLPSSLMGKNSLDGRAPEFPPPWWGSTRKFPPPWWGSTRKFPPPWWGRVRVGVNTSECVKTQNSRANTTIYWCGKVACYFILCGNSWEIEFLHTLTCQACTLKWTISENRNLCQQWVYHHCNCNDNNNECFLFIVLLVNIKSMLMLP